MTDTINPILIIINGPSATGKTTIGRQIAKELNLPFICKDDIKELLFNDLGWSNREWSKKIGKASFDLLWYIAGKFITTRSSVVIETRFYSDFAKIELEKLKTEVIFDIIEINCFAEGEVLLKRFEERSKMTRHPGHVDLQNIDEFKEDLLRGKADPIEIESKIIELDTTDFEKINIAKVVETIRNRKTKN
ncbi:MAG: AAA family ATPase [bacterium]